MATCFSFGCAFRGVEQFHSQCPCPRASQCEGRRPSASASASALPPRLGRTALAANFFAAPGGSDAASADSSRSFFSFAFALDVLSFTFFVDIFSVDAAARPSSASSSLSVVQTSIGGVLYEPSRFSGSAFGSGKFL